MDRLPSTTKVQPATPLRRIAVNDQQCTLYDVASGCTLTETALLDVIAKRDAYPKLVAALHAAINSQKEYGHIGAGTHDDIDALLRELGEE